MNLFEILTIYTKIILLILQEDYAKELLKRRPGSQIKTDLTVFPTPEAKKVSDKLRFMIIYHDLNSLLVKLTIFLLYF